MLQTLFIGLLFLGAIAYLSRMIFRSFQSKKACDTDCKCGVSVQHKAIRH